MSPHAAFELSAPTLAALPPADRPEIAIAGRSNVGKSSLINTAALNGKLARTSNTPGKTQALNVYRFEGIRLVDLPGYGFARAPDAAKEAWSLLVDRYLNTRDALAGVLVVVDARHAPFADDRRMVDWVVARRVPFLVVATKADKLGRGALAASLAALSGGLDIARGLGAGALAFSSVDRTGRRELVNFLKGFET
jgi:GTP-binding protein